MSEQTNLSLHRFAVFTAGATFLLIIAGALVTSNDAGLAVPDWPLSFGQVFPPLVGNVLYEHGHRLVASFVGLLTIVLTLWLWRAEPRRWVRWLGVAALGTVIVQGILGGITVLFLLPRAVSIGHAALAQTFFCLAVSLALFTSPRWKENEPKLDDSGTPPLQRLTLATVLAVFAQLVLGAAYRHGAVGIVPHVIGAGVVAVCAFWTARRVAQQCGDQPALRWPARLLVGLLVAQLALGTAAYFSRLAAADAAPPVLLMVVSTVAHVAVGALTLATSVVLALQAHHRLSQPRPAEALASATEKATA